jgi:FtsH-binding integral membrane protein
MENMNDAYTLSAGIKLLIWFLFVVLLPVITLFVVKKALDRESNFATFLLLAAYTLVDMILAWILTGVRDAGFWSGVLVILAGIAAGFYNTYCVALIKKYGS